MVARNLGLVDEATRALKHHDEVWALHEVTIRETYSLEDELMWIDDVREWLSNVDAG